MDAIEQRWALGPEGVPSKGDQELPTLRVTLDADKNEITIMDNGVGMTGENLRCVFTPHLSPKQLQPGVTRGHKGVGTTFLIYGHASFTVATKATSGEFQQLFTTGRT